jgi:hypothetical protein
MNATLATHGTTRRQTHPGGTYNAGRLPTDQYPMPPLRPHRKGMNQ